MELQILQAVQSVANPFLDALMQAVTMLAEQSVLLALIAAVYWCVDKQAGQLIVFSMLTSLCFNNGMKNIVQAPRPFERYPGQLRVLRMETATGFSFPSGHTQGAATFYTAAAIALKRRWFSIVAALVVLCIAISRMYLGVHFLRDVAAALVLGVAIPFLCAWGFFKLTEEKRPYLFLIAAVLLSLLLFTVDAGEKFADLYKVLGALYGFALGAWVEQRYVRFTTDVSTLKKLLRMVAGVVFVVAAAGIGTLAFRGAPDWTDLIRYAVLVFLTVCVYPFLFTKLKF